MLCCVGWCFFFEKSLASFLMSRLRDREIHGCLPLPLTCRCGTCFWMAPSKVVLNHTQSESDVELSFWSCGSLPQVSFKWVLMSFQLAFFQTGKVPLLILNFFGRSLLSTRTQSWCDIPGIVSHLVTSVSLLVANKSRVFSPLVGVWTIWERDALTRKSRKSWWWFLYCDPSLTDPFSHMMSGRLKSPASHVWGCVWLVRFVTELVIAARFSLSLTFGR